MINPVSILPSVLSASEFSTTTQETTIGAGALVGSMLVFGIIGIVVGGLAMMGMFKKAGRKPWEAFVPVYAQVVLFRIAGMSGWWFLAMLVPVLNIVAAVLLAINLAKVFGQGVLIAVLIILFGVFVYFYLSYGSARYFGPQASKGPFDLAKNPNQPAYAPAGH
ncbi:MULTISPECIES: DUF5684 domain-containing protein [unclassified Arthrobacter]|uniref:DUF5684 domain-containing protein n=1 Tax=unclassified Arthrobacter TaxID=235627 RepID=UPI002107D241|nr:MULTISPECIES: DUF5684 domain-containing protein [unclassified Arthrobacter]MCQ1945986.1 DUF5684 domain-containing protein [Arthrobacter sp. zg-Y1116]MCQ1985924.1 DUF5684 domain-containing protein [Arthrobacter sp. zg-Y844]